MISYRVLLLITSILGASAGVVSGAITFSSEIMYEQEVSTQPQNFTGSMGPVPGNINHTYTTPNASYKFDVMTTATDPFQLKASSRIEINIDARGNDVGWDRVTALASGTSGLLDTAFVDGVPGGTSGKVEFLWVVTGESSLSINPILANDAYIINQLLNIASLAPTSALGAPVDVFIHDQGNQPMGVTSVDSTVPAVLESQSFFVDWAAGQSLDVFFELQSSSKLDVSHFDAAGFDALAFADFSNTATLQHIKIYDSTGTILPEATLTSTSSTGPTYSDVIAVPEPSAACFIMMLVTMTGGVRFAQRYRASQ